MMKLLQIIGLGILIWSLGLLWPEFDLVLVLVALAFVALMAGLVYLVQLHPSGQNHSGSDTRPRHPSRPVMVH